ncbi:MAG: hypothetical protein U0271_11275 [Polyangiaceae bacterium]
MTSRTVRRVSPARSYVLFVAAGVALSAACGDSDPSTGGHGGSNTGAGGAGAAGGAGTGAAGGTADGGDGGAGGATAFKHCTPTSDGKIIDETCGVFVDPSAAEEGAGTQASPFATVGAAAASLNGAPGRIYVCNAGTGVHEAVAVRDGVEIHGAIDCSVAEWRWDFANRTAWTSDPDTIPLTLSNKLSQNGTEPSLLSGLTIEAASSAVPGGSSIALVLESVVVSLDRVDLTANDGSDGTNGTDGVAGDPGGNGQNANEVSPDNRAAGGTSSCGLAGGLGGYKILTGGFAGTILDGAQGLPAQNNGGDSVGVGDMTCSAGGPGASAPPGTDGTDGTFASLIVDALGVYGVDGTDGTSNGHGAGGGGGGAIFGAASYTGGVYPGGGGGAGGCGATPGTAGTAGGSSIALLSIGSFPSFSDVTLSAGQAGKGGQGGVGKPGGTGGIAGLAYSDGNGISSCPGGVGGAGSNGGRGGSGTGGSSLLVAYVDNMVDLTGATLNHPAPSQAGVGPGGAKDGVAADQTMAVRKQ